MLEKLHLSGNREGPIITHGCTNCKDILDCNQLYRRIIVQDQDKALSVSKLETINGARGSCGPRLVTKGSPVGLVGKVVG